MSGVPSPVTSTTAGTIRKAPVAAPVAVPKAGAVPRLDVPETNRPRTMELRVSKGFPRACRADLVAVARAFREVEPVFAAPARGHRDGPAGRLARRSRRSAWP